MLNADLMERIAVPAEPDVPEPGLVPQADEAIDQDEAVEDPPTHNSQCQCYPTEHDVITSTQFH